MLQARLQHTQMRKQEDFDVTDQPQDSRKQLTTHQSAQSYNSHHKLLWLMTGLTFVAIIVSLVWRTKFVDLESGEELNRSKSNVSEQVQEPLEPKAGHSIPVAISEQRSDAMQTSTVSGFEMLPPPAPAAGTAEPSPGTDANTNYPGTENRGDQETTPTHPTIHDKMQEPEDHGHSGAWAINLASLPRKADAEKFAANAYSKGVAAEIDQVMVSGETFWRVQVPGFSSADEAQAKIDEVQEELGLKDVWIVRRQ